MHFAIFISRNILVGCTDFLYLAKVCQYNKSWLQKYVSIFKLSTLSNQQVFFILYHVLSTQTIIIHRGRGHWTVNYIATKVFFG